jgi:hypothetical protein
LDVAKFTTLTPLSRLITPQGRELLKTIENNHFAHFSTGQPTHWPSDPNKIPELVDFCITKGLPPGFAITQSCLVLSPVLVTLTSQACHHDTQPRLCTKHTNWNYFRYILNQRLTLHIPLKTTNNIDEAAKLFTDSVQCAGWLATPTPLISNRESECPILIKQKLAEKRKLRRAWHRLRTPESKQMLNAATWDLKLCLREHQNQHVQAYLQRLKPMASSDYSLWKATKHLKRVTMPSLPLRTPLGKWANSDIDKGQAFANHLATVFQPLPSSNHPKVEKAINQSLKTPFQLEMPAKHHPY